MNVKDIKPNKANPRIIKDEKFKKLVNSIKEFPAMMELRPMVLDSDNTVLGGNMRLKALQELGYKEIPDTWVKYANDLTDEEKQRFIIADNVGFGEWQWDALANDWNAEDLDAWGLDVPEWLINSEEKHESRIYDNGTLNNSADSYLNSSIRQIVLVYEIETHKKTLEDLEKIGKDFNIQENNSIVVLKLIEKYLNNR